MTDMFLNKDGQGIKTHDNKHYIAFKKQEFIEYFRSDFKSEGVISGYHYRPFDDRLLYTGSKKNGSRYRDNFFEHTKLSSIF